jgi:hypothetical protein
VHSCSTKHLWNSCCVKAFSTVAEFLWISSISWNLRLFKADVIFSKQTEVIRCQIRGIGWVFHFSNRFLGQKLLDRSALWVGTYGRDFNRWSKVQALFYARLHVTAFIFSYNKLVWLSGLVGWIQSEQYPWYRRKWSTLSSYVIPTSELIWTTYTTQKQLTFFTASPHKPRRVLNMYQLHYFLIPHKI